MEIHFKINLRFERKLDHFKKIQNLDNSLILNHVL